MSRRILTTAPVETTETGHLVELLYDDGRNDDCLVCAGHGGAVEPGTAETALELATPRPEVSCWAALGYERGGGAFDRWHPPSSEIRPDRYRLLGDIAERGFETVLSLHGLSDDRILVGGRVDDATKRRAADALAAAVSVPVSVAADGPYAGRSPKNFVNWLAADGRGLQLELGPTARHEKASAVRACLGSLLDERRSR